MKSISKSLHENRLKTHQQIRSWLQPKLGRVGTKYRLAARIRKANAWATKHPKRTFACVVGTLLLALVGNIAFSGMNTERRESQVDVIANMEPLFTGFRTIQANKDRQRQTLLELTAQGETLRQELDSLIAIPHKTHGDSIRIIQSYRQLENIVKSLKDNAHD